MKTRRPGDAVRSVFPISSPSQLLAAVPAPMPSAPSAIARDAEGLLLALPSVSAVPESGLPLQSVAEPETEASFELQVAEPPTNAVEGPPAADDGVVPSTPEASEPASAPGAEVVVEVGEPSDAWPQVRRLSAQAVAIRASATSRWIVVSGDLLEVRFLDDLAVPEDAEWLE